ncbi:uncharacterized protein LOC143605368 [Bidens hawaiensis]|uniref:uncharacterized protein LOC143605368 n=1 Tax=Bidens hawaiensis TaxID=980011 RepID=UPI00404B07AD
MADTSRPRVTITLGRSGQVVKRAGDVEDSDFPGSVPVAGIKRSVRDRLGSNADAVHHDNKRQRGVDSRLSSKASTGVNDTHLSKHDLRFKIMKKHQEKNVDLRDMLSQKARSSSTNHKNHQRLPEPRNNRQMTPEMTPQPKDGQWGPVEVRQRDDRRLMRNPLEVGPRDDKRLIWDSVEAGQTDRRFVRDPADAEPRDDRRLMRAPAEIGPPPPVHKLYDERQPNLDPTGGNIPNRFTSTRTSRTLSQMDLSKTSFAFKTLDRPSQHRVLDNYASLPPPPTEEPLRRPLTRPLNDSRPVTYATPSFLIKPSISDGLTKSVGPLVAPQLPTGRIVPPNLYPVDYHTVEGFLHSLGLDKYLISFKVEEVDMTSLSQMGEQDLKEMNIPMGPRKKILQALLARNRRQQ